MPRDEEQIYIRFSPSATRAARRQIARLTRVRWGESGAHNGFIRNPFFAFPLPVE